MCVSALALTSLDSVARIGRMSLQELFKDDFYVEIAPGASAEQVAANKMLVNIAKAGFFSSDRTIAVPMDATNV